MPNLSFHRIAYAPGELGVLGGCAAENAVLTTSVPYSGALRQNKELDRTP